jgi:cell pole-organizing protein PopZ
MPTIELPQLEQKTQPSLLVSSKIAAFGTEEPIFKKNKFQKNAPVRKPIFDVAAAEHDPWTRSASFAEVAAGTNKRKSRNDSDSDSRSNRLLPSPARQPPHQEQNPSTETNRRLQNSSNNQTDSNRPQKSRPSDASSQSNQFPTTATTTTTTTTAVTTTGNRFLHRA